MPVQGCSLPFYLKNVGSGHLYLFSQSVETDAMFSTEQMAPSGAACATGVTHLEVTLLTALHSVFYVLNEDNY